MGQGAAGATSSPPSLVKWTGSKRLLAARIAALAPTHTRYFEPFLGSGAVLYHLARPGAVGSDACEPLIGLWRVLQADPAAVVAHYRGFWQSLQREGPAAYYRARDRFNQSRDPLELNVLLRTCVNGIVRFNAAGRFNNSLHLSRPGMHPDRYAAIVATWHPRLRGVEFALGDYREVLERAQNGDFAYLDPPYAGTRQRYERPFDVDALFVCLDALNRRGVRWALSFDGTREGRDLSEPRPVPRELYRDRHLLAAGHSAVAKVLNGPLERVDESLYVSGW